VGAGGGAGDGSGSGWGCFGSAAGSGGVGLGGGDSEFGAGSAGGGEGSADADADGDDEGWDDATSDPPLLTPAATTCPVEVISGRRPPVRGASAPPTEGSAELTTGAAVRNARTPFGRPDHR